MADSDGGGRHGLLGQAMQSIDDAAWSHQELERINSQQNTLAQAVGDGKLWMEAGVAERAAAECDELKLDLTDWLDGANVLLERPMYGDNEDGNAMAGAVVECAQALIRRMEGFRDVADRMALTYRKAGGLVEQTEQTNTQNLSSEAQ